MKQYLLVLPIDRMPMGAVYQSGDMPLHCTLMRWFMFRGEGALEAFMLWLGLATKIYEPMCLESDKASHFGVYKNVPVHTLVHNDQLAHLHTLVFRFLAKIEAEPADLIWVGAGYRPHVTTFGDREFLPGMQHVADRLVLVEQNEARDKQVIGVYGFKNVRIAQSAT